MLRDDLHHGFPEATGNAAKEEARGIMIDSAKIEGMIPYSNLVKQISSIKVDPHDVRVFHMLGEISSEEDADGCGMLTVVVIHKHGDMQPGPGFFELAKQLGRNTKDIMKCWVDELHKVHVGWSKSAE